MEFFCLLSELMKFDGSFCVLLILIILHLIILHHHLYPFYSFWVNLIFVVLWLNLLTEHIACILRLLIHLNSYLYLQSIILLYGSIYLSLSKNQLKIKIRLLWWKVKKRSRTNIKNRDQTKNKRRLNRAIPHTRSNWKYFGKNHRSGLPRKVDFIRSSYLQYFPKRLVNISKLFLLTMMGLSFKAFNFICLSYLS